MYYLDILGYSQRFLFGVFHYGRFYTMVHGIDAEADHLLSMLRTIVYLGSRVCLPHATGSNRSIVSMTLAMILSSVWLWVFTLMWE